MKYADNNANNMDIIGQETVNVYPDTTVHQHIQNVKN